MSRKSDNSGICFLYQRPQFAPDEPQPATLLEIHAIGHTTRKRSGEIAEAAFLAKASNLGFAVAKPWGDSERYDFILDYGHGFLRVQVKSTQSCTESRYRVKAAGWKDVYTLDEIDFLVAYIIPEDLWYVVPVAAFASRKGLHFYPHSGRHALYEQYREAWCLMTLPRGRVHAHLAEAPRAAQRESEGALVREQPSRCRCPSIAVRCAVCPRR